MKPLVKSLFFSAIILVIATAFIDLNNLENYANQLIPNYITKNNTPPNNNVTNAGATLGRVLFYDKNLSANNTISCSSCHKQQFAFGDTARLSTGLSGGLTGRHSMRLAYARFATENKFFWDERAASLEAQTTRPIQDVVEMGFSGTNNQPDIDSLIRKLTEIPYYKTLFQFVYGDTIITESRIQNALAQFIRSIYSFDSRFDMGFANAPNLNAPFQNFSALENQGKNLFLTPPNAGGAGCQGCHRAPEFDIDPNSLNNGVIADATTQGVLDLTNTRAPSLRDLFNNQGFQNGPMMHNGILNTIEGVIAHYNLVPQNPNNTNLDPRLAGPGGNLQLNQNQRDALVAFLRTLSSNDIYTNPKWSDPFDNNGNLEITTITSIKENVLDKSFNISVYPNPANSYTSVVLDNGNYETTIYNLAGKEVFSIKNSESITINTNNFKSGIYYVVIKDLNNNISVSKKLLKL